MYTKYLCQHVRVFEFNFYKYTDYHTIFIYKKFTKKCLIAFTDVTRVAY